MEPEWHARSLRSARKSSIFVVSSKGTVKHSACWWKNTSSVFSPSCFHLVRRRDEVEDLAQEIFFKAFRAIRSYNFQSSFATWLSRIAVNHCYDYLRKVRASRLSYYSEMTEESAQELERKAESRRRKAWITARSSSEGFRWQASGARAGG